MQQSDSGYWTAEPAYPAARMVAAAVESYFARQRAAVDNERRIGPLADAREIESIITAGFWASLRREEGRSPKISLAFVPPEQAEQPLILERRLPLSSSALTRLAPAVERAGIHLGVWRGEDDLYIWGSTRTVPVLTLVLEVVEPGLLVIKYSRGESFGKFGNVAVLQGEEIRMVDERVASRADCPVLLASLVGLDPAVSWLDASNLLIQLAVSMRAHGRGGALLVVPRGTVRWQESILSPISYRMKPPFAQLSDVAHRSSDDWTDQAWQQTMRTTVDVIAGLTAVDGATLMSDRYELLAFGAKIKLSAGSTPVEKVLLKEPVVGDMATLSDIAWIGGTRHLSAAQFVHDQHDAIALVASQDGRFTIFTWSDIDELVHANRVEALLL